MCNTVINLGKYMPEKVIKIKYPIRLFMYGIWMLAKIYVNVHNSCHNTRLYKNLIRKSSAVKENCPIYYIFYVNIKCGSFSLITIKNIMRKNKQPYREHTNTLNAFSANFNVLFITTLNSMTQPVKLMPSLCVYL